MEYEDVQSVSTWRLCVVILTSSSQVERTLTSSLSLGVEYVKVGVGLL